MKLQAANVVGSSGQPTVDLPPRPSGEKRALRFEPSLILDINATERDAARRDSFDKAIA